MWTYFYHAYFFLFVGLASTDGSSGHDDSAYHDVHAAGDEAG